MWCLCVYFAEHGFKFCDSFKYVPKVISFFFLKKDETVEFAIQQWFISI